MATKTNVLDWRLWRAEVKVNPEDGDYLRIQQCCVGCGQYIGHLPGFWFLEDSDMCPDCRKDNNEETGEAK